MDHLKNSSPHDKAQSSSSATFSSPVAQANTINCSGSVYIWVPPSPSPSLRSTRGSSHPGQEKDERARHVSPPCTVSQPLTPQEPPSSVQNADDRSGTRTTSHVEDVQGKHSASVYVIKHVVEAPQPIDVTSPAPMASEGSTTLSSEPTVGTVREQAAESPSYKRHVCSENQPRQRQHPQATEPPVDADGTDHLHDLGVRLFNTWPYLLYRLFYRHFTKDIIRLLFAVFIAYQLLTTVLVSMCERGGFRLVFQDLENTNSEILHRLVMFCLRLCIRVVTPVCLFQPSVPTVVPTIPRTGLSGETARIRLLKAYRLFSPPHETHEVKISSIARAFSLTERILKRQITTAWVVIVHSVLLVALLYYLGVFFLIKDKLVMKGVCNFSGINTIVFRVPLLNISMHLLVFLELISIFVIVLLICLTKELYCYENKIAVYAVITLGAETTQLYRDIRKRWEVVDYYCYAMPLCLLALLTLSICTGKVFTPSLSQDIEADDIANWYFWIVVLSGLTFLATSPNRMFKFGCLIGYALVGVFIGVTDAKGMDIPAAGSSVMILLFISLAVIVFNLLFTLWRCHLHHWREKRDRPSYFLMLYCFISLCALPAMVAVTMCREVFSLSQFLHTCYIRF